MLDTKYATEINAREFADRLVARHIQNIEFGANLRDEQPEIAIHLYDSTTLFVGASENGKLYFAKPKEA